MANHSIDPPAIAPPAANYAHAVESSAGSRMLHVSGTVGVRPDGVVPSTIADQAAVMWENIGAILASAGYEPSDVVSITTFAVVGEDLAPVMAARDRFMAGHRPASTLVTVPALVRPEWKVEVAVVAARG